MNLENKNSEQFEPLNPLEYLKSIGIQKLYEKTHISKSNLECLLDKEFDKLGKVQAVGFVSILAREYNINLEELKQEIDAYFKEHSSSENDSLHFETPNEKSMTGKIIFLLILVMLIIGAIYYWFQTKEKSPAVAPAQSNVTQTLKHLEKEKVAFEKSVTDANETNSTKIYKVTPPQEKKVVLAPLKIIPKRKLWLGYIDLDTYKKKQTTTSKIVELDPDKKWLILLGHRFVSVAQGEESLDFEGAKRLYLYYNDGVLKEIGKEEFKVLNRGKVW